MDEKTTRIALQIPDDMLEFLERLAKREDFKARKIGRAIRWCIRQEMRRVAVLEPHKRSRTAIVGSAGVQELEI